MARALGRTTPRADPRWRLGLHADTVATATVAVSTAAFVAWWWGTALARWHDQRPVAFDLALFDQVLWNSAHGRLFDTSFLPYDYLGEHIQPVLLGFVPLYLVGGGPLTLLLVQALVCGVAAVVLYAASRAVGLSAMVGAAVSVAYLANPYLHRALAFDFHPETMVALPAFASIWAFARGRPYLGLVGALGLLMFKEDAGFVSLALAVGAALLGWRKHAIVIGALALMWMVLAVGWMLPAMREGEPGHLATRYSVLGGLDGFGGLRYLVRHPVEFVRALVQPGALSGATLFLATAPWVLLVPPLAFALVPGLGLALLSSHPPQRALDLHYAVELVPVVAIAGLFAWRRLAGRMPDAPTTAIVAGVAVLSLLVLSPASPLAPALPEPPSATHREAVATAVSLVPLDAAVSAQSSLAPRLAHRERLWEFPGKWDQADWVIVDRFGTRSGQSVAGGFDMQLEAVRRAYRLVYEADGVMLFQRPAS